MGRRDPRVVTSGPHNRMTAKLIPPEITRNYEEKAELSQFTDVELLNFASNNYGGFSKLEHSAESVMKAALTKLPFAPAPRALEEQVRQKCAEYMKFDECVTAPSGFSTNVLAFATVAGVARSQGKQLVFLCDRDCHNSMFTGAYFHKEAKVHKFDHNDLTDLDFKLRMYREQDPSAFICVAVEGIYRYVKIILPLGSTFQNGGLRKKGA
jgi:serine palmitoyltransferase